MERSAIILSLLALCAGEDKNFNFNLKVGNSLNFDWKLSFKQVAKQKGFDLILGNPPYVCAKNLSVEARHLLEQWPVSQSGNPDLYIPFFQLALEALNDNGILGYITVNSFTKSVNGRKLRAYFHQNLFGIKIIDFGGEQVFKGRTTYTCICIIRKEPSDFVQYRLTLSKDLESLSDDQFFTIPYETLTDQKGWILSQGKVIQSLKKLRSSGVALEKVIDMRGGFATLTNHIFVFKPQAQTNTHYQLKAKNGKEYWIEKGICRDVVKANSLKSEDDLDYFLEKIIFPYQYQPSNPVMFADLQPPIVKYKIIVEKYFLEKFPDTYFYLSSFRKELDGRDKGNGKYEAWYAYGRTQGLISNGHKLLFPHISDKPYFVYTDRQDLLFYNGFALVSQNYRLLMILKKVLTSDFFWFYVKHTSKPYSSSYYGLGKNFIKDFHVPIFTKEEEDFLIHCESNEMVNDLLSKKYDISLDIIYSSLIKLELES